MIPSMKQHHGRKSTRTLNYKKAIFPLRSTDSVQAWENASRKYYLLTLLLIFFLEDLLQPNVGGGELKG